MGRTSDARHRLMEAASQMIWEYSYGSVTIDALCDRAKVRKGSFYYFFESKSDLATAALDAWWVQRKVLIEEMFRPEVPPLERIAAYFDFVTTRQLAAFAANGQVLGCPLFSLGSEISTQDERLRSRIHGIITAMSAFFEEAIVEAQSLGDLESNDPALTTRQLLTYYAGVLVRARTENNPEMIRTMCPDAFELIGAHLPLAALA